MSLRQLATARERERVSVACSRVVNAVECVYWHDVITCMMDCTFCELLACYSAPLFKSHRSGPLDRDPFKSLS